MIDPVVHGCPEYEREHARAQAALDAGDLLEARQCLSLALAAAQRHGEDDLVDRAICGEAAVAIELGGGDSPIPRLREVLLRSSDAENCSRAALVVARAYELARDFRKSLFYARLARDRAAQAKSPERLAVAHNQIGNALLGQSFFREAETSFRQALRAIPRARVEWRLIYVANLGYCAMLDGRLRDAVRCLCGVLREARRHQLLRVVMITRIDLCYAYVELQRPRLAERSGRQGLALAERIGELTGVKNALYLLGQVAVTQGEDERARGCFEELQRRFFPDQPRLADLLVSVDVRPLINLRA